MMKKISMLLCGVVMIALCSCGGSPKSDAEKLADMNYDCYEYLQKCRAKYEGTKEEKAFNRAYEKAMKKYEKKIKKLERETEKVIKKNKKGNKKILRDSVECDYEDEDYDY